MVSGLLALLIWIEQTFTGLLLRDGSQALVPSSLILLLILASVVLGPIVLFDFARWLRRNKPDRTILVTSALITVAFVFGFLLKWNGSLCIRESAAVSTCWAPEVVGTSVAVGLAIAALVGLAFRLFLGKMRGGDR